ncbi:hypothetical protein AB0J28_20930 [Streptosporangium canum]|uniref:hypothetical protein n=1 Tax=Streptosporangium canum TaxID=324952 RepID=UPI00341DE2DA
MSTDPERRAAFVTGLRELADFIEANSEVPIPRRSTPVHYFPKRVTDAEMCAEIDRIAELLDTEIDPVHLPYDHYMTTRHFGPISYEAVAILAGARTQQDPSTGYRDRVTPDTDTTHAA